MLTKDCNKDQFKERLKLLSLVIFNYDRCVEKFLFHAICAFYRVEDEEAKAMLSTIRIHHPYGSAGSLFTDTAAPFGGGTKISEDIFKLHEQIKTFSENTFSQESDISEMIASLKQAKIICFLGFSFGEMNMRLLDIGANVGKADFYATTHGMSDSDTAIMERRLGKQTVTNRHGKLNIYPLKCEPFFKEVSNAMYQDWISG